MRHQDGEGSGKKGGALPSGRELEGRQKKTRGDHEDCDKKSGGQKNSTNRNTSK